MPKFLYRKKRPPFSGIKTPSLSEADAAKIEDKIITSKLQRLQRMNWIKKVPSLAFQRRELLERAKKERWNIGSEEKLRDILKRWEKTETEGDQRTAYGKIVIIGELYGGQWEREQEKGGYRLIEIGKPIVEISAVEELANRAARREKDLKTPPAIRRLIEKSGRALPKIRIEELDEIAEAPGKARIRKEIENSLELTIKHLEEESAKSKKDAMEKNVKREKLADELKVLGFPRDFFTIGTFGRGTVATKFVILPPAKQIAEEYKQKKAELLKMAKEEGMETKGKTLREINDELIRRQRKTSGLDQLY